MTATHRAVLRVVEQHHLADKDVHVDAKLPPLGGKLLKQLVAAQRPRVLDAFDRMARDVSSTTQAAATLFGIHVKHVAGVDATIDHARALNVQRITGATSDFLDSVKDVLAENEGERPETIRKALQDRVGISERRGALIARTETTTLNSQIVEHRARSAGLSRYTWSSSEDERVRPIHAELDGQVIEWDNPPEAEKNGDRYHAGRGPNCRCVPAPYVEETEEGGGEDVDEAAE